MLSRLARPLLHLAFTSMINCVKPSGTGSGLPWPAWACANIFVSSLPRSRWLLSLPRTPSRPRPPQTDTASLSALAAALFLTDARNSLHALIIVFKPSRTLSFEAPTLIPYVPTTLRVSSRVENARRCAASETRSSRVEWSPSHASSIASLYLPTSCSLKCIAFVSLSRSRRNLSSLFL